MGSPEINRVLEALSNANRCLALICRSNPIVVRFVLLFVVVAASVTIGLLYASGSLPEKTGSTRLDGISSPISIRRDLHGVPHIKAKSDRDVFFAMGYVHAQDRLWQLEIQRRIAAGRLSEIFGSSALKEDIWLRTLSLREAARASWLATSDEAKDSLLAYAEGVNAWIKTHPRLPPEFSMLGVTPEPWTVIDSLAWAKVYALSLSGNSQKEIAFYLAAKTLSKNEMSIFFDTRSLDSSTVLNLRESAEKNLLALYAIERSIEESLHIGGPHVGSNAWAVSGRITSDGGALLANDPHLILQMPSVWYPVVQDGLRIKSSGMSIVGLPLVIFGENGKIAWGGTNMEADVQDLYFEQINAADPTQYRVENGWERIESHVEWIRVKADFPSFLRRPLKPVRLVVRSTRHGPIISDAVAGAAGQPMSLRWTALDADDTTYNALFRMNMASDWASFKDALREFVAPTLNILYADSAGNIGYLGVGRIPIRSKGNGSMPRPGWNSDYWWEGYIPTDALPQIYNPSKGYLVSANDRNVSENYPFFISNDWAPPARGLRISELIESHKTAHPANWLKYSQDIQADTLSRPAQKMLGELFALCIDSPERQEAINYLKAWDGEMGVSSQGATIFAAWMDHLNRQLFVERLPLEWARRDEYAYLSSFFAGASIDQTYEALSDKHSDWCNHDDKDSPRNCRLLVSASLDAAQNELTKLLGSNIESWTWGSAHSAHYDHAPFSRVRVLDSIFGKHVQSGGSADTINVANAVPFKGEGYRQTFGATFRQIIYLSKAQNTHVYMNSTGQSGNVLSTHYADMIEPFSAGQYFNLQPAPLNAVESDITLSPAAAR
jgi:penicillin amidase